MSSDDEDGVGYDELQRRARLAGDDPTQTLADLREKYADADVDEKLRADGSGGTVEAERHPEGQDAEEPPADGSFAELLDLDVDDDLEPTHPTKRLAEARKQIALAMDDLDVDGAGRIPVVDDDGFEFSIVASGGSVRLEQIVDGDRDDVRLDRPDALLVSTCLRVLALDT